MFHAVTIGPGGIPSGDIVAGATKRSLQLLRALGLSSIAFPAIGAGVAGFTYEDVAANMAEAIVEELHESVEPLIVTIYLFDRFGRMQPIDYIQFFEEFAARTRGLRDATTKPRPAPHRPGKSSRSKRQVAASAKRSGMLAELAELDRERQALEGRLAQYSGALARPDVKRIEARLKSVQEERIALLSAVNSQPSSTTVL